MTRWLVLLLVAVVMMACGKPYERQAEFVDEEYAPYQSPGRSRICGQAYVTLEGGRQHVAPGDRVLLAPVTSYTLEAIKVKVMQGRAMVDPDPKAIQFERHTKTDDEGRFCVANLSSGEYFVVADIALPTSTQAHRESQLVHTKVSVKADENIYILLTR